MTPIFAKHLKRLESKEVYSLFRGIKRGFEKECLRVNQNGILSQTAHPKALGSSLTHPFITTDFAEALLEFITPPTQDVHETFRKLSEIHAFVYYVLERENLQEYLWAGSMPCHLPSEEEISIAKYGSSNLGQLKYIYRKGLGLRYGRRMQTIAGIHYNFSLPEAFFKKQYHLNLSGTVSQRFLKDFISEQYLAMMRNSLRWGWILPLLFGATPAICKGFFNPNAKVSEFLEPWIINTRDNNKNNNKENKNNNNQDNHNSKNIDTDTYFGKYATSLRLSDLGYHNKAQTSDLISYNSFPEFLKTMHHTVHTPDPYYTKLGVQKDGEYQQLNDSILQIEDEHYAMFRPKRVPQPDERTISALSRDGIEYIEVRALDINPFLPLGVEPKTQFILDTFLITCLFLESPPIEREEMARIHDNHQQIVLKGRNPTLTLIDINGNTQNAVQLAQGFLNLMLNVAHYLDRAYSIDNFSMACRQAKRSLDDLNSLPSARMLNEMKMNKESYFEFIKRWSLHHKEFFKDYLTHLTSPQKLVQYYDSLSQKSLLEQAKLEKEETIGFPLFLDKFLAP